MVTTFVLILCKGIGKKYEVHWRFRVVGSEVQGLRVQGFIGIALKLLTK
jgi:hypothetical protein